VEQLRSDEEGYRALHDRLVVLELGRDVVRVAGPDAASYLQGQLSQDVLGLGTGGWAWSLLLQPQGKLDAFVRVYRVGPEELLLDTDAGMGPAVVERLLRFRLRTRAVVEQLPWRAIAVRGAGADARPLPARAGAVAVPFEWQGLVGYDLLGPAPVAPEEAVEVGPGVYEPVRIEAGFPRHGAELDAKTIPAEAGLIAISVSFTKGCYTGQELVARIDSRGSNVPRHLRGLLLSGPAAPGALLYEGAPGSPEKVEGGAPERGVGRLTSVAWSPTFGWVALGYVGRSVAVGETVAVGKPGSGTAATVQLLPLSSPAP